MKIDHFSSFAGKRVFVTGHTGFKGSWLSIWLNRLGAEVYGYSLEPPTSPNLYHLCEVDSIVESVIADIRDYDTLSKTVQDVSPEIIFHMAAQPLVRESYRNPIDTYAVNVMGTVNIMEALRCSKETRVFINVTSDKCYENREWLWAYREGEALGGYDPYSSSKACSEFVTSSYRNSFFNPSDDPENHMPAVATVRAGNVIGGGDWGKDRLIPDCIRSILAGEKMTVRYPNAIRPWQHVLDPLNGYLLLAAHMLKDPVKYSEAWNFGPDGLESKTVGWMVKSLWAEYCGKAGYVVESVRQPHEATYLKLDSTKARVKLGWKPCWSVDETIKRIVEWTNAYECKKNLMDICHRQIGEFESEYANGCVR